ncbi:hypothetical protein GUJ93_ZPchr0012g22167 [Zizania palustris]|nr:hypothetical protein GUJ93_ZPchr0012g22167 [Zizania palustris]
MPSSVLSSDSMHTGFLAAAAHASATNSRFTIFYNPRASPSEFVIPLAKYVKAVYHTHVSVGTRFRMLFETEESNVRRYMGTITGISDLDSVRWPNSHWRSVKVGWDESTTGDKQPRVSLWEIEPLTTFPMYPSAFPLRLKCPWASGLPMHGIFNGGRHDEFARYSSLMWLRDGDRGAQALNFQGHGVSSWLQPRMDSPLPEQMQCQSQQSSLQAVQQGHCQNTGNPGFLQDQFPQLQLHNPQRQLKEQELQQQKGQQVLQEQSHQEMPQQLLSSDHCIAAEPCESGSAFQAQSSLLTGSLFYHQNLLEGNNEPSLHLHNNLDNFSIQEASNLLSLPRNSQLMSSEGWPSKRLAVESVVHPEPQSMHPKLEKVTYQTSISHFPGTFPPLSARGCSIVQDCGADSENCLLSSSFALQDGMTCVTGDASREIDSMEIPLLRYSGADLTPDNTLAISNCLGQSETFNHLNNICVNPSQGATFVKVYKSGSLRRSLDISRFRSYYQAGSLYLSTGENDILLVGDDPWQEFVNSVWCIKILSPQEVQHLVRGGDGVRSGDGLLSEPGARMQQNVACNYYSASHNMQNITANIASAAPLDY